MSGSMAERPGAEHPMTEHPMTERPVDSRLDCQVLIAGGGPAGLTLACELALGGIDCIVLEASASRPNASGGMLLPARTAQYFHARGLADRLELASAPAWPRTHFGFLYLNTAEHSPDSMELVVPQWRTTAMLLERAAQLGVRVISGCRLVGLHRQSEGVAVELDGDPGQLTASYLVGCDGPHSAVARLAGFGFEVLAGPYYGLIGDFPADACYSSFQAGSFSGGQFGVLPVNPADPREIRLMTVENGRYGPDPSTEVTVGELAAAIGRITGDPVELGEPNWLLRYGSETRAATELRRGRVLLCGDAAHAHPPSAGNGLNTAVHDALNLGWKLATVLRGQAGPELLDSYAEERLPVARRVCVRASAQLPVMEPARVAAPLREVLAELLTIPGVARHLIEFNTEIGYPLGGPADEAVVGTLVPSALPESLPTPDGSGMLLRLGLPGPAEHDENLVRPWSDRVRVRELAQQACPQLPAGRYLIRPDGYVGWADTVPDRAASAVPDRAADDTGPDRAEADRPDRADAAAAGLVEALVRWFGKPAADLPRQPEPAAAARR